MEAGTYWHLPVKVQAMQVTAGNLADVADWCGGEIGKPEGGNQCIWVPTIGGQRPAWLGWWIVMRGLPPEFYPLRPDVFPQSYTDTPADASVPPAVAAGIARIAQLSGRDDD